MRFSTATECAARALSLLSAATAMMGGTRAFTPPSQSMTAAHAQHRLQYVRHEDEMGWMMLQQQQSRQQEEDGREYYYEQRAEQGSRQGSLEPDDEPPLDYEARVERRFSRYRRRRRLRDAASAADAGSYGAEMDRRRRELDALNDMAGLRHPHRAIRPHTPPLVSAPIPIVNFRTNSDFPASDLPASRWTTCARHPPPFEDAEYSSCARVDNARVLVPVEDLSAGGHEAEGAPIVVFEGREHVLLAATEGVVVPLGQSAGRDQRQRAYWLRSKLHDAIYGQVRHGTVLQKLDRPLHLTMTSSSSTGEGLQESTISVEWTATPESVAIKEMSWEHIRTQREKLAEDPIKEVAAMQHLQDRLEGMDAERWEGGEESHIVMPLDLLSDERNLYSVTPYCAGGRLLDMVEGKGRFSEPEARYWMHQILQGLTCLKNAGVAHRDMSPENLMVHGENVYIIDLGMCLRIPSSGDDRGIMDARQQQQQHQRSLILPQTPCGKWYYLSPEVCLSESPFDGPAVDLWAAGVILFVMLVGSPPWEEPKVTDENFRLVSTGHLARLMTERCAGLSVDAMDLLQRMFWLDPADRLSLEQVRRHPWMMHEEYNLPLGDGDGAT